MSERIAVFGAGISGRAACRLAQKLGHTTTLFDERAEDCQRLDVAEVPDFDRFVFSPGFAEGHAWRIAAEASGRPCQSEPAFAAMHWKGRLIGITGTNGKTSLTRLLTAALQQVGCRAEAVGNVGRGFSDFVVDESHPENCWAVCELSSFQAELPNGLELDGLIWTNFAEDHLERYPSLTTYFEAKARLLQCVKPGAPICLGSDVVEHLQATNGPDSILGFLTSGEGEIGTLSPQSPFSNMPQLANFTIALKLWEALGFDRNGLITAANVFELDAHRCALVGRHRGVAFWDDSKATNFHAAEAAVQRMDLPVYWIGGGSAKGGDLAAFAQRMAPGIECAFLYGAVGQSLGEAFAATNCPVQVHDRFESAVRAATIQASQAVPSVVLMSPGFASFDQFLTYSERGKSFISIVLSLMEPTSLK